jgi:hypothetical protein
MFFMMNYNIQRNNIIKFKHCNDYNITDQYSFRLNYIISMPMFHQSILQKYIQKLNLNYKNNK